MKAQAAPNSADADYGQRDDDHHGQVAQRQADESDAQAAEIGLALGADIEQPGMEGDREGKAGEDEIRRIEQRVAEARAIAEGAVEHDAQALQRRSRR